MALLTFLTLAALFFSLDFAVVGIALLIHSFIASDDQVRNLRAVIPRGTVLDVNRHGEANFSFFTSFVHSCLPAQI